MCHYFLITCMVKEIRSMGGGNDDVRGVQLHAYYLIFVQPFLTTTTSPRRSY